MESKIKTPEGNNKMKYKEFYKEEYYIKIALNTERKEIIFISFNIKLLDWKKYTISLTKNDFYNSNLIFKNNYNTLEKIFDFFLNLMSRNNYIIKSGKNNIDLYFNLNNNSNKINNYNIKLQ